VVVGVAFLVLPARRPLGQIGRLPRQGENLLAGPLALQHLTDGSTAGLLGQVTVTLAVLLLQAKHIMGQAGEALGGPRSSRARWRGRGRPGRPR
jgi:hypothetical protein